MWKRYHEPKFLRNERKVHEEQVQRMHDRNLADLRQRIGQDRRGFQPQTRRAEQWTVDPFWEMNRPTPAQTEQNNRPGQ